MDYTQYLHFLAELQSALEQLTQLQPRKIEAVRAHDLDQLNDCMKQEQAFSLTLRGLEQKRDKLLNELGLSGVSLREMAKRCPPEYRDATAQTAEQLLRQYELLHSAQQAARTVVEGDLRRVNQELERRGMTEELDTGYQPAPGMPPSGMRTDFRA